MYVNNAFLDRMLFPVCCSNFCKAISVTDQNLFYWAYFVWDRHYEQGTFFRFEGKTSGIKNLQFDSVCGSIINPIPPAVVSSQFTDIIAPIYTQIQNLIKESKLYFTVRDTILPLLMNGQVEVK